MGHVHLTNLCARKCVQTHSNNCFTCLHAAAGTATGSLSCPIQLRNSGNVGLLNVNLQSPSIACTASVLEPSSAPYNCTVTLPSTLDNFEQGSMALSVVAAASPRGEWTAGPITGQAKSDFALQKVYEVSVLSAGTRADPASVSQAGRVRVLAAACSISPAVMHARLPLLKPIQWTHQLLWCLPNYAR